MYKHNYKSMYLRETNENEVYNVIIKLKNATCNNIYTVKIFKLISDIVCPYITEIINDSFNTSKLPLNIKKVKIIPIYKNQGIRNCCDSYRPIALQSIITKIYEKIIYDRLIEYLEKNNILIGNQFGFRKGHSTAHAILSYTNRILDLLDKRERVMGIFIDLKKAFDTINQKHLLDKMYNYGIRGKVYELLKDYFRDRYQCVYYNKITSSSQHMSNGVIQGSILGALFFIIYVNDINEYMTNCKYISLYADDTAFIISNKTVHDTYNDANKCMNKYQKWAEINKLHINIQKTNYMLFGKQCNDEYKSLSNKPQVMLKDKCILKIENIKFLGVHIDEKLKFDTHIDNVIKKIQKSFHVFYRIRNTISNECKKMIFCSLVESHINYCILAYGSSNKTIMDRLQKIKNRALRILYGLKYYQSVKETSKKWNYMEVGERYKYEMNIITHRIRYRMIPSGIIQQINVNRKDNKELNLRNKNSLWLQSINTNYGKRTLNYLVHYNVDSNNKSMIEMFPEHKIFKKMLLKKMADRKVP